MGHITHRAPESRLSDNPQEINNPAHSVICGEGQRRAFPGNGMPAYLQKIQPPSDDKRWKIVAATMKKLGNRPSALIEALHTLQQVFGYLDKPGLIFVAAVLRVPPSQVFGAATFYHYFTMKPQGEHSCIVCTGTACYIKGANALLKSIEAEEHVKPGQTTPDNRLSVLTARCFGACGLAPVAVVDGEMESRLTTESLQKRLHSLTSPTEANQEVGSHAR